MERIDTLISARWLIPIEPRGCVLDQHAIAIRQGRIVALGPATQLEARFDPQARVDRPHHVVLPGWVNTHTHAAMTLLRGAVEAADLRSWLEHEVWPLERRWMDAEYVRDGTELAIAELLRGGTTCFADMHLFPEVIAQAASDTRIRASVGLPIFDIPTVWAGSADEYFRKGLKLHDEYRDDPLITTVLAPYSATALSEATLLRVRRIADELELPITMHVNESRAETERDGERSIAKLDRLGLLSPLLTAVHLVHLDAAEMERCAAAAINIAHCPQSNLKLGNGVCPAAQLRALGANVTLGTDGAASNNDLDLLDELKTAALLARGVHSAHPMSAHDWLYCATLAGARALGLGEVIGSITPGKWADLCCIDLRHPATQPVHDVANTLLFSAGRDQVSDVWVAGRALLEQRRLLHLDEDELFARTARWQRRISAAEPSP